MLERKRWRSHKVVRSRSGLVAGGNTHLLCGTDAVDAFENRARQQQLADQERRELAAKRVADRERSPYGWSVDPQHAASNRERQLLRHGERQFAHVNKNKKKSKKHSQKFGHHHHHVAGGDGRSKRPQIKWFPSPINSSSFDGRAAKSRRGGGSKAATGREGTGRRTVWRSRDTDSDSDSGSSSSDGSDGVVNSGTRGFGDAVPVRSTQEWEQHQIQQRRRLEATVSDGASESQEEKKAADLATSNQRRLEDLRTYVEESFSATKHLNDVSELLPSYFRKPHLFRRPLTMATANIRASSMKLEEMLTQSAAAQKSSRGQQQHSSGGGGGGGGGGSSRNGRQTKLKQRSASGGFFKLGRIRQAKYAARTYSSSSGRQVALLNPIASTSSSSGSRGLATWNDVAERQQMLLAKAIAEAELELHTHYEHQKAQVARMTVSEASDARDRSSPRNDDPFTQLATEQLRKQGGSGESALEDEEKMSLTGSNDLAIEDRVVNDSVAAAIDGSAASANLGQQNPLLIADEAAAADQSSDDDDDDSNAGLYDDNGDDEALWSPKKLNRVLAQREAAEEARKAAQAAAEQAAAEAASRRRLAEIQRREQAERELAELKVQQAALEKIHRAAQSFLLRRNAPSMLAQQRAARDAALYADHSADLRTRAAEIIQTRINAAASIIQRHWRKSRSSHHHHSTSTTEIVSAAPLSRHQQMRERVRGAHLLPSRGGVRPVSSSALVVMDEQGTAGAQLQTSTAVLADIRAAQIAKSQQVVAFASREAAMATFRARGEKEFATTIQRAVEAEYLVLLDMERRAATTLQAAERRRQQKRMSDLVHLFDSLTLFVQLQVVCVAHANSTRLQQFHDQVAARERHESQIKLRVQNDIEDFNRLCDGALAAVQAEAKKKEGQQRAASFLQRVVMRSLRRLRAHRKHRAQLAAAAHSATHGFHDRKAASNLRAMMAAVKLQSRWRGRRKLKQFKAEQQEREEAVAADAAARQLQRQQRRAAESTKARQEAAARKALLEEGLLEENAHLTSMADSMERAQFVHKLRATRAKQAAAAMVSADKEYADTIAKVEALHAALDADRELYRHEKAAALYRAKMDAQERAHAAQQRLGAAREAAHRAADDLDDETKRRRAHEAADKLQLSDIEAELPKDSDDEEEEQQDGRNSMGVDDDEARWLETMTQRVSALQAAIGAAEERWGADRVRGDDRVKIALQAVAGVENQFSDIERRAKEEKVFFAGVVRLQALARSQRLRKRLKAEENHAIMISQAKLLVAAGEGTPLVDGALEAHRIKFASVTAKRDRLAAEREEAENEAAEAARQENASRKRLADLEEQMQGANQRIVIQKTRLGLATASALVMETFIAFDTDMDGYIDMEELGHLFDTMEFQYTHEYLVDIVERFDTDHNGVIDLIEFQEMMKVVMKELETQGAVADQAVDAIVEGAVNEYGEVVADVTKSASDKNDDGTGGGGGTVDAASAPKQTSVGLSRKATILAARFTNSVWKQEIDDCKRELGLLGAEATKERAHLEQLEMARAAADAKAADAVLRHKKASEEYALEEALLDSVASGPVQRKIRLAVQEHGANVNYAAGPDVRGALQELDRSRVERYRHEQMQLQREAFEKIVQQYELDVRTLQLEIENERLALAKVKASVEMHSALATKLLRKKDSLIAAGGGADDVKQSSILAIQYEKMMEKVEAERQQLREASKLNTTLMATEDVHAAFRREEERLEQRLSWERTRHVDVEPTPPPPATYTALLLAARSGSQPVLEVLLELKAELHCQAADGNHALSLAAQHGHSAAVKFLLSVREREAEELEQAAHDAERQRDTAYDGGFFEEATRLEGEAARLRAAGLAKRQSRWPANNDRRTILHLVCQQGLAAIADLLAFIQRLPTAGDQCDILNARGLFGMTALHECVRNARSTFLRQICDAFAAPVAVAGAGPRGPVLGLATAATAATATQVAGGEERHVTIVQRLKLELIDERGRTPLHCAVQAGLLEAVQVLLDAGADPNASIRLPHAKQNFTHDGVLCYAAALKNQRQMRFSAGPGPATALFMAVVQGNVEVVQALLASGAQLCRDLKGRDHLLKSTAADLAWQVQMERADRERRRAQGYAVKDLEVTPEEAAAAAAATAEEPDAILGGYDEFMVAALLGDFPVLKALLDKFCPSLVALFNKADSRLETTRATADTSDVKCESGTPEVAFGPRQDTTIPPQAAESKKEQGREAKVRETSPSYHGHNVGDFDGSADQASSEFSCSGLLYQLHGLSLPYAYFRAAEAQNMHAAKLSGALPAYQRLLGINALASLSRSSGSPTSSASGSVPDRSSHHVSTTQENVDPIDRDSMLSRQNLVGAGGGPSKHADTESTFEHAVSTWLGTAEGVSYKSNYGIHFRPLVALVCTQITYFHVLASTRPLEDDDEVVVAASGTIQGNHHTESPPANDTTELQQQPEPSSAGAEQSTTTLRHVAPLTHNDRLPALAEFKLWYADSFRSKLLPCARAFARIPNSTIQLYLRNGLEMKELVDKEKLTGQTHARPTPNDLFVAAEAGDVSGIVFSVVRCGTDPNTPSSHDLNSADVVEGSESVADNYSALLMAASFGQAQAVEVLLHLQADPNFVCSRDGMTALLLAAYFGHTDVVHILLNLTSPSLTRANHDVTDGAAAPSVRTLYVDTQWVSVRNGTSLSAPMLAAQRGHAAALRVMLSFPALAAQANAKSQPGSGGGGGGGGAKAGGSDLTSVAAGDTALIMAAALGHAACVRELCSCVAVDVDLPNDRGMTAVYAAVANGQVACLDILVEAGANVQQAARTGATPLFVAVCRGDTQCVDRLLQAGARPMLEPLSVNERQWASQVPSWDVAVAAFMGDLEVLARLVDASDGGSSSTVVESASNGHQGLREASAMLRKYHGKLRLSDAVRAAGPGQQNTEDKQIVQVAAVDERGSSSNSWKQHMLSVGTDQAVSHAVERLFATQKERETQDSANEGISSATMAVSVGADAIQEVEEVLAWDVQRLRSVLAKLGFQRRFGSLFPDFVALTNFRLCTCPAVVQLPERNMGESRLLTDGLRVEGRATRYILPEQMRSQYRYLMAMRRLTWTADPFKE